MANNVTDLGKVGITMKGEWSSSTAYERLDSVMYDGSLWIALADNTNSTPSINNSNWMLSAKHGEFTEQQLEDFKAEVVAESKEEMDDYTEDKKDELDTYTSGLESDFNTNASSKTTDFNNNATSKTGDFDSNASSKTTAFNTNASDKTTAFNSNATSKTSDFNDNASSKTNTFNSNATEKTTAFDNNASAKTTAFNENATSKTTDFNTNATSKTGDFNDNATAKTTAFDEHVDDKIDEFDENAESLQQEIDELSANMPWAETEQATSIDITDAAKYSRNKLELFGNTEQAQYTGKNLFDMSDTAQYGTITDGVFTSNDITTDTYQNICRITAVTPISVNEDDELYVSFDARLKSGTSNELNTVRLQASDNTILSKSQERISESGSVSSEFQRYVWKLIMDTGVVSKFYLQSKASNAAIYEIKNIMVSSSSDTDYEPYTNGPAPNPDYPQNIHVVTGNNTIKRIGKNLWGGKNFTKLSNGVLFELKADGTISANGTAASGGDAYSVTGREVSSNELYTTLVPGTYTFHVENPNENIKAYELYRLDDGSTTLTIITNTSSKTFTLTETTNIGIRLRVGDGSTINNYTAKIMIEQGSTATDYVPYIAPQDYAVNLGSIELCKIRGYQDTIFKNTPDSEYYDSSLVENGWYKYGAINKIILDGTENWASMGWITGNKYGYRTTINNLKIVTSNDSGYTISKYLTNYSANTLYSLTAPVCGIANRANSDEIILRNDEKTSKVDLTNWLSLNNIPIYFVVANATTTQITDTTLIEQLEAIYNHLALTKGINHITITPQDLAPYVTLNYMQDLPSKLNNLASRIELLEE